MRRISKKREFVNPPTTTVRSLRSTRSLLVGLSAVLSVFYVHLYKGVATTSTDATNYEAQAPRQIELWLNRWVSGETGVDSEQQATSKNTQTGPPELFIDRLNRLLPEDDHARRLSLEDIARIEQEVLQFDIPRNVTVQYIKSEYMSIQFYRWLFHDQSTGSKKCPRCHLRFDRWAQKGAHSSTTEHWYNNSLYDDGLADVIVDGTCPKSKNLGEAKQARWQVTVGSCGESQDGSGSKYAKKGRPHFDYHAGFEKVGDGVFQTTYAHLHLSPDNRLGFPELWNITDMAQLLLRSPGIRPPEPEPAMFVHNNCGAKRGSVMRQIAKSEPPILVARYNCMKNKHKPNLTLRFEAVPCAEREKEYLIHNDCYEPTRDAGKTVLSSFHKFTFSLENTFSQDYFTEKRWGALFAGSVPIVWDNHNSLDSLPDPDTAMILPHNEGNDQSIAESIVQQLDFFKKNETAFQEFFEWKKRGLKASFVRKLFLSNDFLVCRICEQIAHRHMRNTSSVR